MIPDFVGPVAILSMLIPFFVVGGILLVVIFSINKSHKAKELEHIERLRAIEKGYPIPVKTSKPKTRYPFAWPFVFMGFGLALSILFFVQLAVDPFSDAEDAMALLGFGLTFLFIGGGLFASRIYKVRKDEMNTYERQMHQMYENHFTQEAEKETKVEETAIVKEDDEEKE